MKVNLKCQSPLNVFFLEKIIFDFFLQKGNIIFVTFIHTYRKYHIFMYFLRKSIFYFPPKWKIYFREKNTIFPDNTRKIVFQCDFFGKTIFQNIWEKEIRFLCSDIIIVGVLPINFVLYLTLPGLGVFDHL